MVEPERPPESMVQRWRWIPYVLMGLALVLLLRFGGESVGGDRIPYSEFRARLAAGEVEEVWIEEGTVRGTFRTAPEEDASEDEASEPDTEERPARFQAYRVPDEDLRADLEAAGVEYHGVPPSTWFPTLLIWVLPLLFLWLVFRGVARGAAGMGGAAGAFGKSRARLVPETGTGVDFGDVAGCDEAKVELRELVEFLRHPARFTALGAHVPKGVLLLGPPGTGKTLLARAVAGEAEVPFYSISGSDFVEMFVGVGAARVRDLFREAQTKAPCIVFIDEIDAVGRQRGVSMGVVNDEREQTLNQLLSEMDGFEPNSGVVLLAATNRPEVLDRALLRPGRFDRQVVLDAPDRTGRLEILKVHARDKPMHEGVDLDALARATPGMVGADLANALNEAALLAARRGHERILPADVDDALERVVAGPERRSRRLSEPEKRRVAWHEGGHALVASSLPAADPVRKVSIVPRGRGALGYTMQLPREEVLLRTRAELEDRLTVLLAGRSSEELGCGEISTGAVDDLQQATALARQMVCLFGMSDEVGLPQCAREVEGIFLRREDGGLQLDGSEETARRVDAEVRRLLDEARGRAREILARRRDVLERVVAALLERETLDGDELAEIVGEA